MAPDLTKLASLIRICGFLMQTKAYLFWKMVGIRLSDNEKRELPVLAEVCA